MFTPSPPQGGEVRVTFFDAGILQEVPACGFSLPVTKGN